MTTTQTSLHTAPSTSEGIEGAVRWLKAVCRNEGCIVKNEWLPEELLGGYSHQENEIVLSLSLEGEEQMVVLLHEVIHLLQYKYGLFIPTQDGDELILQEVDKRLPLAMWVSRTDPWREIYTPEHFEERWLLEVGALYLEYSFNWFKEWYTKTLLK